MKWNLFNLQTNNYNNKKRFLNNQILPLINFNNNINSSNRNNSINKLINNIIQEIVILFFLSFQKHFINNCQ